MKTVPQKESQKSKLNSNSKRIQKQPKNTKNKVNPKLKKNQKEKDIDSQIAQPTGIEGIFQKAKKIYEERERQILEKKGNKGDAMLMKKIMESGTLADKVSALAIRIREHPKLPVDSLMKLLAITKTESRRKNLLALDTLKELFLETLLESKKLNIFSVSIQQYNDPKDDELVECYREHRLKELYQAYIKIIETGLRDDLGFFKENLTRTLGDLLKSKPEQENLLLSLLVNKFGDNNKKYITVLNKVLLDVLFRHKSMTIVVTKEVENFIKRPNISNDAIFYALNFLTLLNFNLINHETLMYLSKLFFTVFFKLADTKEEENEKIHRTQSILLNALNRIFPLIKELDPSSYKAIEEHIDQLFKMSHQCTLRIRIQALILLYQFLKTSDSIPDRFYRVLYEVLFTEELKINTSCQLFYDVLYNALKDDFSVPRIKAFIKRILQVALHADPPFAISSLLLVSKILQVHAGALSLLKFSDHNKFSNENEEETFKDVPDPDDKIFSKDKKKRHIKNNTFLLSKDNEGKEINSSGYDAYKREPLYSNSDNALLYELLLFKDHYHPTVKLYATKLLEGINKNAGLFDYNGNPWLDHSFSNFLDRISFKKPKKIAGSKQNKMRLSKLVAPISETFTSDEAVRADEEYFVKYFQTRVPRKDKTKKAKGPIDEEAEMDAYADKIFEEQLQDIDDDDFDDDELLDEDDVSGGDGEGDMEEEGETFEDLLENMGDDENDMEEEMF